MDSNKQTNKQTTNVPINNLRGGLRREDGSPLTPLPLLAVLAPPPGGGPPAVGAGDELPHPMLL